MKLELLLISALLIGAVSCGPKAIKKQDGTPTKEATIVGGYGEAVNLTGDELEIFTSAMKDYDTNGKHYIPKSVSTQIVAGTNYKFICEIEGEDVLVEITIFKPLPHTNKKAEVTGIKKV